MRTRHAIRGFLILLSLASGLPVAHAGLGPPKVDSDLMDIVLSGVPDSEHDQVDKRYREFVRDYEEVFKKIGLPGPDVDPDIRNRRMLKAFKKLPIAERLSLIAGARKEIPQLVDKMANLDAQSKLDDQKAIDAVLDSFPFMSKMPVPTEGVAPVYFGDLIQRLGIVRRGRATRSLSPE